MTHLPPPPPQQPGYGPQPGFPPQPGYPPQPGGYAPQPGFPQQPGYGPQPGYHPGMPPGPGMGGMPPRPPRRNTGWIIGGIAGGVVLFLLLGIGAVLVLTSGDDAGDPPISQPPAQVPEAPDAPDAPPPGGGTYGYAPDLCQTLDLSQIFEIMPTPDPPEAWTGFEAGDETRSQTNCHITLTDDLALGSLLIDVFTNQDPEQVRVDYELIIEGSAGAPDSEEDLPGWDEGKLLLGNGISDEAVRVHILDDNLALSVDATLNGAPGAQAELEPAVIDIAEQIVALCTQ